MKEHVKLFPTIASADGHVIDAPFIASVVPATEGAGPINIQCSEEGKMLSVSSGVISIVDAPTLYTLTWNTEGYASWGDDKPTQAAVGETISAGYHVGATPNAYVSINGGESIDTGESSGTFTFTMPAQNTTVLLLGGSAN